jgi:hypothetical protein
LDTSESRSEIPEESLRLGAAEGWRRTFGWIVWEIKYYTGSRRKGTFYVQSTEERLIRLATSCEATSFSHTLLKER